MTVKETTKKLVRGRATCDRLDLNDDRHNEGSIIKARRFWVKGGWHPPDEDPQKI